MRDNGEIKDYFQKVKGWFCDSTTTRREMMHVKTSVSYFHNQLITSSNPNHCICFSFYYFPCTRQKCPSPPPPVLPTNQCHVTCGKVICGRLERPQYLIYCTFEIITLHSHVS